MQLNKYKLGKLIEWSDERNENLEYGLKNVKGISIKKEFIETKADMDGVSLKPYKIVKKDYFAYVPITSRNGDKISIALLKEYWNQGIGTLLFQELIRIAEENPNLIQIELEFVEGNSRARALYEKMGFRITGVKPNAIRLKDGTLLNEYSMIREIKR